MDLINLTALITVVVAIGALLIQIIVWRSSKTDRALHDINTSLREIAAAIYETKQP